MVLLSFSVFFQKYSALLKEKKTLKELTHTAMECVQENLTIEGKKCCNSNSVVDYTVYPNKYFQ